MCISKIFRIFVYKSKQLTKMSKLTDYFTDLYLCKIQHSGNKLLFKIMNTDTKKFDTMLLPITYLSVNNNFGIFACGYTEQLFYMNNERTEVYLTEETFEFVLNDYLNPSL